MRPKRKAEAFGSGPKTSFTGYEIKAFSTSDHIAKQDVNQCRKCKRRDLRIRQLERLIARLADHIDQQG